MRKITLTLIGSVWAGFFITAITFGVGMGEARRYLDSFDNLPIEKQAEQMWIIQQRLVGPTAIAAGSFSSMIVFLLLVSRPTGLFLMRRELDRLVKAEQITSVQALDFEVALHEKN